MSLYQNKKLYRSFGVWSCITLWGQSLAGLGDTSWHMEDYLKLYCKSCMTILYLQIIQLVVFNFINSTALEAKQTASTDRVFSLCTAGLSKFVLSVGTYNHFNPGIILIVCTKVYVRKTTVIYENLQIQPT